MPVVNEISEIAMTVLLFWVFTEIIRLRVLRLTYLSTITENTLVKNAGILIFFHLLTECISIKTLRSSIHRSHLR